MWTATATSTSPSATDGQPNRLYRNDGGVLTASAVWSSSRERQHPSVAWGDVDGDGDLDLGVGMRHNLRAANRLYRNDGGVLTTQRRLVLGDEEAVSRHHQRGLGRRGRRRRPRPGRRQRWPAQPAVPQRRRRADQQRRLVVGRERTSTDSVAWGDVDGDGDLDLAVGNDAQPNRLYRNDGGVLTSQRRLVVHRERTAPPAWPGAMWTATATSTWPSATMDAAQPAVPQRRRRADQQRRLVVRRSGQHRQCGLGRRGRRRRPRPGRRQQCGSRPGCTATTVAC